MAQVSVHAPTLAQSCIARNDWLCWDYVTSRQDQLLSALREHVFIAVVSVVLAVVIAVPVAVAVRRWAPGVAVVLTTATVLYTIPSLALFSFLYPVFRISPWTVVTGLVLYNMAVLLQNTLDGLAGVSPDAVDAARGMGYGPLRLLLAVELPLALPTIMAGVRVAMVSTVALTTIGTIVGHGGFGTLIAEALRSNFRAQVLTAAIATVVLALVLDAVLLVVQRLATPWTRERPT